MEFIRECINFAVDSLVATVYYKQFYEALAVGLEKLQSMGWYKAAAERLSPYLEPPLNKIRQSPLYIDLIDRLTPIKQE